MFLKYPSAVQTLCKKFVIFLSGRGLVGSLKGLESGWVRFKKSFQERIVKSVWKIGQPLNKVKIELGEIKFQNGTLSNPMV